MSVLEIVLYSIIGTAVAVYIGISIYRIKHPKKKKEEKNADDDD